MTSVTSFGWVVLVLAAVGLAAVLSSRLSERLRIPAPAIFLLGAAVAPEMVPGLRRPSFVVVEHVVTVALALILFDGGMRIGWSRLRPAAGATLWIGVVGTVATAGVVALCAHLLFQMSWRLGLLLGTALAPTDPAVVFSVLGRREIAGRAGVLLEGESGANDPVGIALMVALLAGTAGGRGTVGAVALQFGLQMAVGLVVGVLGARLVAMLMRRPLPSEGLYPLRVLTGALGIYGAAAAAHGSGYLAVFVAGILLGDRQAPYKGEIRGFHSALANLAEIVAFMLLGLTVHLPDLLRDRAWSIGIVLAVLLAFVIRPLLVGLLLWPIRMRRGERLFVLWTGLKGAVPILLGAMVLQQGVAGAHRLYDIIFTVVACSVIGQGGLVPALARRLDVPLRTVEPEPWSMGVRFRGEPETVHRRRVAGGSPADGTRIADLPFGDDLWVSVVTRRGHLLPVRGSTRLQAGDEIVLLGDLPDSTRFGYLFEPGDPWGPD